jgi:hypothetical protein
MPTRLLLCVALGHGSHILARGIEAWAAIALPR